MFSVIIPLYNKSDYIAKAIRSVLDQTYYDFELIIIDDGSTDNSPQIVKQFTDPRIRVISQENAGVSTARNNGVKASKYKYIAFLDADDWWDLGYLEEMKRLINKYPDVGLWAAKYYKVKHGKYIEANIGLEEGFKDGYIEYFKVYAKTMWMPITSSSFIVDKKVFGLAGGYKKNLKIGEDFDLWVRLALKNNIVYINKPLAYYNQDIDIQKRALGWNKIWKPEFHYIFQLGYLSIEEQANQPLKTLLDNLRAYTLMRYYLSRSYVERTNDILSQINYVNIPFKFRLIYSLPPGITSTYYNVKRKVVFFIKSHIK